MSTVTKTAADSAGHDDHHHDHAFEADANGILGFWLYIMTDCVLFATLFAAFAVLHNSAYGGPYLKKLIELPYVFGESMFLLVSNLFYGMAILAMYKNKQGQLLNWLILTIIFGLGFVGMELNEFVHLVKEGYSWHHSAELTSFFALVGTHGLHVSIGMIWMLIMIVQVVKFGITGFTTRRLVYLGLFWNFLDIVWIFVFTFVYLMGAI